MAASARRSRIRATSMATGLSRTLAFTNGSIRIWTDFAPVLAPYVRKWKWRTWIEYGVEFLRRDRNGQPRGVIQVIRAEKS